MSHVANEVKHSFTGGSLGQVIINQCDFESDLCSWQNVKGTDKFDWNRQNAATPTGLTGPVVDHTKKTSSKYKLLYLLPFILFIIRLLYLNALGRFKS